MSDAYALEKAFGDPRDPANPLGYAESLRHDERGEPFAAGEELLDEYGLSAEFVPTEHGGRLATPHRLIEVMRAVYRRDPALGLGYGTSALMAAANVWTAGTEAQREAVARLLLHTEKLACAYHELDHGNDLAALSCTARAAGDGYRLSGGKEVIANVERARTAVVFARTAADAAVGNSHSQLLVDLRDAPAGTVRFGPRFRTSGMRGVQLHAVRFHELPVPADAVLGKPGSGIATALRSFQLTRVAVPGMSIGILDTALRVALRYAHGRVLYGRPVADLPLTRAVLTTAYADLLLCDAFVTVAANALLLAAPEAAVLASAVKALVPQVLIDAVNRLAVLLGSAFYRREGEHALLQKLVRDIQPTSFGHAGRASCLSTLLPQLPLLARRAWRDPADPQPDLIAAHPGAGHRFQLDRLALGTGRRDAVGTLPAALLAEAGLPEPVRRIAADASARLEDLAARCAALPPSELSVLAGAGSYRLAGAYAAHLALAACLGIWWRGAVPESEDWLVAAAHRLASGRAEPLPDRLVAPLWPDLLARFRAGRTFDLAGVHLPCP